MKVDKRKVQEAIYFYNKYRSPESSATLINIRGNEIIIRFDGPYTCTCGVNDWVEDFVYLAEDIGLRLKLVKIIEPEDGEYRIGVFTVV